MIAKNMEPLVKGSSVIRAMFEEGKKMSEKFGEENVFDFSLGNPHLEPPIEIKNAIIDVINNEPELKIHGYMPNAGFVEVREKIAAHINKKQGTNFTSENIIMTVGAAGGMNVIFRTILDKDDEVVTFAPYFGEYKNYVANYGAVLKAVEPDTATFFPRIDAFESIITAKTKAVIINTPNNPTGVIYPEETIKKIAEILRKKQAEFGTTIYLVSDEPYREISFEDAFVPYVTKYYNNTIVCYSYSKSLSLPGDRIGYLVIPSEMDYYQEVFQGAVVANRILGYVNAPSLMQLVIARCLDASVDMSKYLECRTVLYEGLEKLGFTVIKPMGAFYIFMKCPIEDDTAFANKAKEYNLLVVPASSFGCSGFVRICYCMGVEKIRKSLTAFERLAEYYNL